MNATLTAPAKFDRRAIALAAWSLVKTAGRTLSQGMKAAWAAAKQVFTTTIQPKQMTTTITPELLTQLVKSTGYGALAAAFKNQLGLNLVAAAFTDKGLAACIAAAAPQLVAEQFVLTENGDRYSYTTLATLSGTVLAQYEQVNDEVQMQAVSAAYLAEARTAANA